MVSDVCSGFLVFFAFFVVFFSSRRRHTRCALVTGVQTCALPISFNQPVRRSRPSAPAVAIQRLCWCWDTTRRLLREWATASAWRVEVRARKAANRGSRLETNRQSTRTLGSRLRAILAKIGRAHV